MCQGWSIRDQLGSWIRLMHQECAQCMYCTESKGPHRDRFAIRRSHHWHQGKQWMEIRKCTKLNLTEIGRSRGTKEATCASKFEDSRD